MRTFFLLCAALSLAGQACSTRPDGEEAASAAAAPSFVSPPAGPVDVIVRDELARAARDGASLIVYVGAEWCEPCRYFHGAIEDGKLALGNLRILEFDDDKDAGRLRDANYGGSMLPRFIIPNADGTASELRFSGSLKGPEAVADISRKLEKLLAQARRRAP